MSLHIPLRAARNLRIAPPTAVIQVQVAFRHGARTPVEDAGCKDEEQSAQWCPAETDKTVALKKLGKVSLFRPGSGDALDPDKLFKPAAGAGAWQGSTLHGGGHPGKLTNIGLQQGVDLGAELRGRYMDVAAATSADVRRGFLLPRPWKSARRLVAARSTRVERTVYTAQGVLSGIFPEAAADGSLETAISLNAAADRDEYMVLNDAGCPRLRQVPGLRRTVAVRVVLGAAQQPQQQQ